MRVQKTNKRSFILIVDIAIFTGVIIGVLVATMFTRGEEKATDTPLTNPVKSISTFVIGDYSDEEDRNVANIKLKQDIKKKYDIDVFSAEASDFAAKSVEASPLYDLNATYDGLTRLVNCLEKYPDKIFEEIQDKGYDISIYLLSKFSNDNIALATRDSNNNFGVYISNTHLFEKAVHHELYHILEYYMKLEFDIIELYKDWTKYNPPGFKYNSNTKELDIKYVYNPNTNAMGSYFVTIYSKSADKEDRAEVFADMMLIRYKPVYYSEGEFIGKKAQYIAEALEKSFKSVVKNKRNLYWRKYI